jgi:hypothetical protein
MQKTWGIVEGNLRDPGRPGEFTDSPVKSTDVDAAEAAMLLAA